MSQKIFSSVLVLFLLIFSVNSNAAVYRVAKNKDAYQAQFDNIQDAVNACKSNGDLTNTIIIADDEVYEERVEIDSMYNLTIVSQTYLDNPNQVYYPSLPTIKYQDREHTHPHNFAESKTMPDDFQKNGALAIMHSSNIIIEGIRISGGDDAHGFSYNYPGVWPDSPGDNYGKWPLAGGNNAIAIFLSKKVTIRNCDIYNAYFGIYVVDRNPAGLFSEANPGDNDVANQVALSNYGQMGNHLFELNRIHDNTFAVGTEIMWGLGSIFRHNLVYNNFGLEKNDNMYGGAFRIKDHVVQPWLVYNNTFYRNECIIQHVYWRAGTNFIFANNVFGEGSHVFGDGVDANQAAQMDLLNQVTSVEYNTWQFQFGVPNYQVDGISVNEPPYYVKLDQTDPKVYLLQDFNKFLANFQGEDFESVQPSIDVTYNGNTYTYTFKQPSFDSKVVHWGDDKENYLVVTNFKGGNVWRDLFVSTDSDDPNFLVPNYDDPYVNDVIRDRSKEDMGVRDADGTNADVGALCILQDGKGTLDWTGQYKGAKINIVDGTYVNIDGTKVTINFPIEVINGKESDIDETSLQYVKVDWYDDLPFLPPLNNDPFPTDPMPNPVSVLDNITSGAPRLGANQLTIDLPKAPTSNSYGMFHIIVSAKNKYGQTIYSNIAVFPYRNFTYVYTLQNDEVKSFKATSLVPLEVSLEDADGNEISEAEVGQTFYLHVKSTQPFTMAPDNFNISAFSGDFIFDENGNVIKKWPEPFVNEGRIPIKFMKTGYQIVIASGYNDQKITAIGSSKPIEITPAEPNYAKFIDPPSSKDNDKIITPVPAFSEQLIKMEVYDRFGNLVKNRGGEYYVKISIDNDYFKLVDPAGEFELKDDGTVTFKVLADADYEQGKSKKSKLTATLYRKSDNKKTDGPSDETILLIAPPLEILHFVTQVDTAFIGNMVPIRVFPSKDGKNPEPTIVSFQIVENSFRNLEFYWDENKTQPIEIGKFYTFTSDTVIYVTSFTEGVATFSAKEQSGMRVRVVPPVFIQPPVVEIFLTWSKDSTDLADQDVSIPISNGKFSLYAWGKDELGNIFPISVKWYGLGVFENVSNLDGSLNQQSITVPLSVALIGSGKIRIVFEARGLEDTTGTIRILDRVDEIYLIRAADYDSNITREELKAVELKSDDVIDVKLGDSIALYSVGVDTTKNLVFLLPLPWTLTAENPNYKYYDQQPITNKFQKRFDINEVEAIGLTNVLIEYVPADTTTKPILRKSCKLNIIDPVDNIIAFVPDNVDPAQMYKFKTGINDGDTAYVDANAIFLNRNTLGITTYWLSPDSQYVKIATKWEVQSLGIEGKVYKYPQDTFVTNVNIAVPAIDFIKFTVQRNNLTLVFYVKIRDLIQVGIYPNPVPVVFFKNEDKKPTIRIVKNGSVQDIHLSILDIHGNVVKQISGIGKNGFVKEGSNTNEEVIDSTGNKIETYFTQVWDGKNTKGQYVSSGVYILHFKVKLIRDGKEQEEQNTVKFYVIGRKEN